MFNQYCPKCKIIPIEEELDLVFTIFDECEYVHVKCGTETNSVLAEEI